jgi:hypothetical protein
VHRYFVITVDTEPDDQWEPPGPDGRLPAFRFANTRGLGKLKDFLHQLGVPVTWMTSYSVVRDAKSAQVLREAAQEGDEIAGHLHGWETPPYREVDARHRPFMYEYDPETRFAKHQSLIEAHLDVFGARPWSYRAGRWGLDPLEYEHIERLGYGIDSSIPPGIDFRDRGGLKQLGPDFRQYLTGLPIQPYRVGTLWESPISIVPVGLLGSGPLAARLARLTAYRETGKAALAEVVSSTLAAADIHRLVWLRPLKHPRTALVRAAQALVHRGDRMINIMFHSSEAFVGTSPLSRTPAQVAALFGDLRAIIEVFKTHAVVPLTLRNAVAACTATA